LAASALTIESYASRRIASSMHGPLRTTALAARGCDEMSASSPKPVPAVAVCTHLPSLAASSRAASSFERGASGRPRAAEPDSEPLRREDALAGLLLEAAASPGAPGWAFSAGAAAGSAACDAAARPGRLEPEVLSVAAAMADLQQLPRRPLPAAAGAAAAAGGRSAVGAAAAETAQQEARAAPALAAGLVRRPRTRRLLITAVCAAGLSSASTAESVVFT